MYTQEVLCIHMRFNAIDSRCYVYPTYPYYTNKK